MLENLNPKNVFKYFEEITKVPHCSYKEEKISQYLLDFAKERNLEAFRDEKHNVLIKMPATNNKKDQDAVILQGHMDMVCVKKADFEFDFDNDPLPLLVDGDRLRTKGTSLGADNGIAVAMILAILDDPSIEHPPIEALFTTLEEVGLIGASNVNGSLFSAKTLINIDSEEEGIFTVSCCGGLRHIVKLPINYISNHYDSTYKISISGLVGGHSGMEINKQRANAIKLMGRLLNNITIPFRVVSINGGEAMNAIAKFVDVEIATNKDVKVQDELIRMQELFRKEFSETDKDITITMEQVDNKDECFDEESTEKMINLILVMPYGVIRYSDTIENLPETSTNLGVITTDNDHVTYEFNHRSSKASSKSALKESIEALARLAGAATIREAEYTAWEYEKESKIRELFIKKYKEMFNKEPEVGAVHAGLECGILQERIGKLDMISFGPDMSDVHTPMESLSISSVERMYKFLLEILKEL